MQINMASDDTFIVKGDTLFDEMVISVNAGLWEVKNGRTDKKEYEHHDMYSAIIYVYKERARTLRNAIK